MATLRMSLAESAGEDTDRWPVIFYLFPLEGLKCMSKE